MQVDRQRYLEMIDSFLDLSKMSDDCLVESLIMVFIPKGGTFADANIVTWIPDIEPVQSGMAWERSFMSMALAMIRLGADREKMKESIDKCDGGMHAIDTEGSGLGVN